MLDMKKRLTYSYWRSFATSTSSWQYMLTASEIGGAVSPHSASYSSRYFVKVGIRSGTGRTMNDISAARSWAAMTTDSGEPATQNRLPTKEARGRGRSSVRGCG